jgi:hypothetical protein
MFEAAIDAENWEKCRQLGHECREALAQYHKPKNIESLDPAKTEFLIRYTKRLQKQIQRDLELHRND